MRPKWGCNAGLFAAPCDLTLGGVTASSGLVLHVTASPTTVVGGGWSSIVADPRLDSNN